MPPLLPPQADGYNLKTATSITVLMVPCTPKISPLTTLKLLKTDQMPLLPRMALPPHPTTQLLLLTLQPPLMTPLLLKMMTQVSSQLLLLLTDLALTSQVS